nr:hypothetical protein Iba_chr02cCG6890 [Ipomoea batatas]GMC68295.1 hypothetical protein Iba_chr02fCG10500 [Ipomoea batatas]GMD18062.1 hypothetical protein Iba_chr07dCG9660 [Ipomoea batatas]GMD39919.1 hypothetical protein Iba_chr10aCG4360 [Ipomoea batatas]GMD85070.1 hypothetical protein Iba_chr14aCG20770 [Ipomoea batatas]
MLRLNALARPPEMVTVRQKRHPRITGEGTVQLCAHLDLFNVGSWKVGVLSPIKMVKLAFCMWMLCAVEYVYLEDKITIISYP